MVKLASPAPDPSDPATWIITGSDPDKWIKNVLVPVGHLFGGIKKPLPSNWGVVR